MLSIEEDFGAVLKDPKHPLHAKAIQFQKYTKELYSTAAGQEWMHLLIAFAGHPMCHSPLTDALLSAHRSGRCEVTAFLLRRGSDGAIPIVPEPTNQPEQHNGQHKQRRTRAPKGR